MNTNKLRIAVGGVGKRLLPMILYEIFSNNTKTI